MCKNLKTLAQVVPEKMFLIQGGSNIIVHILTACSLGRMQKKMQITF